MNTLISTGRRPVATLVVLVVAALTVLGHVRPVSAWPCRTCGPQPGFLTSDVGATTPCGSEGCGPRYWGPRSAEPCGPDPCDNCNRWHDCNGRSRGPDLLAPWQLPPGRGFMAPSEVGYITENPCEDCSGVKCCLFGGPSCLRKMNPCYPDCILTLFPWPWKRRGAGCRDCRSCQDCQPAVGSATVAAETVPARAAAAAE